MNTLKKATGKTLLSLTLATTLFFSPNINGSAAHAEVGNISYDIPTPIVKDFSYIEKKYKNDLSNKTVILTTNDVHGAIEGYPYAAAMKKHFSQDLNADVLLIDAGDFSQDKKDPKYVTPNNGLAIECMNSAGYDIAALGNHEGMTLKSLQTNLKKTPANFDIIDANILKEDGSGTIFLPNCIRESTKGTDKIKIGFFGLATRESKSSGMKLLTGKDMKECAQEQYNTLKGNGADIVICLAHLGLEDKFEADGERSVDIYNAVKDIDLVVDGHSHSVITPTKGNEPILSTGTEFENIGVIIIDNNTKTIDDTFLVERKEFEKLTPDSATDELVAGIIKNFEESKNNSKKNGKNKGRNGHH